MQSESIKQREFEHYDCRNQFEKRRIRRWAHQHEKPQISKEDKSGEWLRGSVKKKCFPGGLRCILSKVNTILLIIVLKWNDSLQFNGIFSFFFKYALKVYWVTAGNKHNCPETFRHNPRCWPSCRSNRYRWNRCLKSRRCTKHQLLRIISKYEFSVKQDFLKIHLRTINQTHQNAQLWLQKPKCLKE